MNINKWMENYKSEVLSLFGERVWFIGLQGSRGRGEAEDSSDIDAVLILESILPSDLEKYRDMLEGLPEREKVCGFFSGRAELENWDKAELFQFCNDTVPLYGTLEGLLGTVTRGDIYRAVRSGACSIYHAAVHNFIHGKETETLKALYKSAVFVLQAQVFLRHGSFIKKHSQLAEYLLPEESLILNNYFTVKKGGEIPFDKYSAVIIDWASEVIRKTVS